MAGLKNIKIKIQSVNKTRKVTRAMEAVSAVKMRKSQDRALSSRPYASAALSVLARISGSGDLSRHALMHPQEGKTAILLITSDKGLAGALNSSVLRTAEKALTERGLTKENTILLCIGRRGADYFANRGYDIRVREENMSDDVADTELQVLTDTLLTLHREGSIGSAIAVYTNFLSTFEQRAVVRDILPLTKSLIEDMVRGIAPTKGRYSYTPPGHIDAPVTYLVEPGADAVLKTLLPKLVNVAVFHALMESKASEHSARMVAMKNATDKAKEVAKDLNLEYNKARQAAITREVSEITSGIEAMR
jgi:F-type H+-transporting ATPase subunit gamma